MDPREFLKELMRRSGDNPNSLAEKVRQKTKQPQIYKFLEGISKEPRRSTLQPIAMFYKVSVDAFYDPDLADAAMERIDRWDRLADDALFPKTTDSTDKNAASSIEICGDKIQKNKSDELVIPQFDTGGAMGSGLLLRDQPGVIQRWVVNSEWINKNIKSHTGASNLCIVTGFGDSMKGMFNSGDPLVIDKGIRAVEFDAVYFFRVAEEGFIKRLQRIPGEGLRVLSENKKYDSWTIKPGMDFEVFGRVVKAWQGENF